MRRFEIKFTKKGSSGVEVVTATVDAVDAQSARDQIARIRSTVSIASVRRVKPSDLPSA